MNENKVLRKFIALVNQKGLDDGGVASFTFEVDELVKGKTYIEADQRNYDFFERQGYTAAFFVDDNGCSRDIATCIKMGIIEEIL